MVLLTLTAAARAAIDEYSTLVDGGDAGSEALGCEINNCLVGSPIGHQMLVDLSSYLVQRAGANIEAAKRWRLDALLKGASVYQPPPPTKTEHVRRTQILANQSYHLADNLLDSTIQSTHAKAARAGRTAPV